MYCKGISQFRSPEEIQPDLTVRSASASRQPQQSTTAGRLTRFPSDLLESSVDPQPPRPVEAAGAAGAVVLPIDFQETSTLNEEIEYEHSQEAMVRVYQPPVVNNSRGQSTPTPINGFQVCFYQKLLVLEMEVMKKILQMTH